MPGLQLNGLLKQFGKTTAVNRINLEIQDGEIMTLHTLYHADEVRPVGEAPPVVSLSKEEISMATKLVEGMQRDFKLEAVKDNYHEALEKLIKAKLKGKEVEKPPERVVEPSYDLLKALKESVAARREREKAKA